MGKKQIPVLVEHILGLVDGSVIEVDTPEWQQWLDNPENRSFRFDDLSDSYTCRKEKVRGQDGYWYAYRSVLGKTKSKYVGKNNSLTYEKLKAVGFEASAKLPKQLPNPVGNAANQSVGNELGNTPSDDVRAIIEAMNHRLEALEKRLGKRDSLEVDEVSRQLPNALPTELDNELPSSVGNGELSRLLDEVAVLKGERDALDKECDRLSAKIGDLDLEKQTLSEELREARRELAELRRTRLPLKEEWNCYATNPKTQEEYFVVGQKPSEQELKDRAHNMFTSWDSDPYPGCRIEYRSEPIGSAAKAQAVDANRRLRESLEKNAQLSRQILELKEQMQSLPTAPNSEPSPRPMALPDAANLLNRLRKKDPKSRIGIRQIEDILDLLSGEGD